MKWCAPENLDVPIEFVDAIGGSNLVGEILFRRGITDIDEAKAFLHPEYFSPSSAEDLNGLVIGADIIRSAIKNGKRIGVWGDFDVDGQTATTLLVDALQKLGGQVEFHIPNRERESHGINLGNLEKLIGLGIGVLITCDTGISAHAPIAFAKKKGLQVVITDHHDLPLQLPDADSIINPKKLYKNHPLSSLPGVGVAYKLIEYLFEKNGLSNETEQYLDLVALGIVADVAKLSGDTRYLLQRGLQFLQRTDRLGLKVLFENAELVPGDISEDDIGFSIAPRLNSLGRLSDANVVVEFLTTSDEGRVRVIANQLDGLNAERKLLTNQVFSAVSEKLFNDPVLNTSSVLVVEGDNWPGGVLGLVASRLVEQYKKPALVLSTKDGISYSGSARSIYGVDISQAIAECSAFLDQFGGHPMAAGVSLSKQNIKKFRSQLLKMVASQMEADQVMLKQIFDLEVKLGDIHSSLAKEINTLSPFGPGNPPVILAVKNIKIISQTGVGRGAQHLKFLIEDRYGERETVFWWGGGRYSLPSSWCNLAFVLKENIFQGVNRLQLELVDFWVDDEPSIENTPPKLEVFNLRNQPNTEYLIDLAGQKEGSSFLWSEVLEINGLKTMGRSRAYIANNLFVLSLPPSQDVFRKVLERVNPMEVYFVGKNPDVGDFIIFLRRLSGILKYALKSRGGLFSLDNLVEGTAQTTAVVLKGLEWFTARGEFTVNETEEGTFQIKMSEMKYQKDHEKLARLEIELRMLINESNAYRKYLSSLSSSELSAYISGLVK